MDQNTRMGLSAEFLFAAEAIKRDWRVAWPTSQAPWDLIVENNVGRVLRVQVKSVGTDRMVVGLGRRNNVTRKYQPFKPGEYDILAILRGGIWHLIWADDIPPVASWPYRKWMGASHCWHVIDGTG